MKQNIVARIVRATIAKYFKQPDRHIVAQYSHVEKDFVWMDKTGRNPKAAKIGSRCIENTWDLYQCDWKNGKTLGDFVENCNVDDLWKSKTEMLECLSIN